MSVTQKIQKFKANIVVSISTSALWEKMFLPLDCFCTLVRQPDSWQLPQKSGSFSFGKYDQKQKLAEDFDERA